MVVRIDLTLVSTSTLLQRVCASAARIREGPSFIGVPGAVVMPWRCRRCGDVATRLVLAWRRRRPACATVPPRLCSSASPLMTDRFEMSMMGEMKFFLGFEIKQLRGGTFINQAKYLQDMLKRFKMTEMKGVATPMVTKCHLALDPNGGASRGGRRRSRHDRSSDEYAPNAPRKSVASRRKNKEVRENYKAMDPVSYSAIRMKNWYEDVPRDEEIEGRRYWCMGEFIYKDVYEPMKNRDPCKLSMWTFLSTITLKMQSG
ncbi:hypothetical protein QYE76_038563 [Lolium multiflorum]|uniref:Reverse transcriptase Ty1/copia-type domain-containing protein n=1 Tax=Lolium multiflorum TaxID=4521 RepID=A0AAD8WRE0_LOLMU|nr:hypothetical protein QYE76_038563 [Lolium multiflorum]